MPEQKLCPILSLTSIREISRVVGATGQPGGEATACQGAACALYIAITGAQGQVVGGGCAIAMIPAAIQHVVGAVVAKPEREG